MLHNEYIQDLKKQRISEKSVKTLGEVLCCDVGNICILYLNARSLKGKLDSLEEHLMALGNIDVIVISETWLKENQVNQYNLYNYTSRLYVVIRKMVELSIYIHDKKYRTSKSK